MIYFLYLLQHTMERLVSLLLLLSWLQLSLALEVNLCHDLDGKGVLEHGHLLEGMSS